MPRNFAKTNCDKITDFGLGKSRVGESLRAEQSIVKVRFMTAQKLKKF